MLQISKDELDPLASPSLTKSPPRTMTSGRSASPLAPSVWLTVASSFLAAISSIAFAVIFQRALNGFARQIGAFISVGDWNIRVVSALLALFAVLFILYLLFIHLASLHFFTRCLNRFGSSCVLFFSSFGSQAFLLGWVLALCAVCAVGLVYFIFIGGIYAFCALINQECFDFKVLLPAIARMISNKNVDLTFCESKQELLCNRENNMIWSFGAAFLLGLIAFAGSLMVQNAVVYSFGKRQGSTPIRRAEKTEQYEMKGI